VLLFFKIQGIVVPDDVVLSLESTVPKTTLTRTISEKVLINNTTRLRLENSCSSKKKCHISRCDISTKCSITLILYMVLCIMFKFRVLLRAQYNKFYFNSLQIDEIAYYLLYQLLKYVISNDS
jgi:hypothetical protein